MNRKKEVTIVVLVSLVGLALLYYGIKNGNLSGIGEVSGGEGLGVLISNVEKDVSEYTLMEDYNGGLAKLTCGSLVTATFTLTDMKDKDTAVNVSLTARGKQIQTQRYILKAGEQIDGSIQGSYPKCGLNKDEISLKISS